MNHNLLFSIGIPAFKASYLKECIATILNQTYTNFELIIVNDASPEKIKNIVEGFSDKRIRYYENDRNTGAENVVDNWNKCLSYAKGDYFVLMGDDDVLHPNYLEEFDIFIKEYPAIDVFHCRSIVIDEKSNPISINQSLPEFESVFENIWHRMNEWRQQYVSDFVYKTSALKMNGGFFKNKLAWASDDITSFIAMKGKGIVHINKPLFQYRRSPLTISSSGSVELKLKAIEREAIWYEEFLKTEIPQNEMDLLLKENIKKRLPIYFKKKSLETIAYHGYNNSKGVFRNFIYWVIRRKRYKMSIKEMAYALILALKKKEAQNYS
ncbi:glycosyltransferase family A protein [Natronoflexus pectinivorans]|uniref:Glycosyl transferase family 2 n=1 Tax=Natronoflexus pectinivorans TaxID=682526 RepID=A0A4R2GHH6_9BACT|nr:glycosyltransferase family A protein [Natronoflexus pectinivorans]TCO07877.1 glycosyl transferase family 2 [Natronoflexus pectinivorans]